MCEKGHDTVTITFNQKFNTRAQMCASFMTTNLVFFSEYISKIDFNQCHIMKLKWKVAEVTIVTFMLASILVNFRKGVVLQVPNVEI